MSRRDPRPDQTTDPCGCIRTPIHGLIDACNEHNPWTHHNFADLGYFVRMRPTSGSGINTDFEVFCSRDLEAEGQANLDNVEPFVLGWVKWDGCCDYTFKKAPLHFCDREALVNGGLVMRRVYDLAFPESGSSMRRPS